MALELLNQKLLEASYVSEGSKFFRYPAELALRERPIIVPPDLLEAAKKRVLKIPLKRFHSIPIDINSQNDFYLTDGGVVEMHHKFNSLEYLGIWHESPIGLAYITKKLELPTHGPRY
jgi:hypothetical protein